ncbi:MAG: SH3 domain-containing protein [Chloroflexi bacterium]|nr:SH3 domain-containing protein [Chloroflexota bacterium]
MTKRSLYALLCLLVLALAAPAAHADCVVLQTGGGVTEYINVDAGDSVSGRISIYQDPDCETEIDYYLDNPGGFVYENSLEDAHDTCEKNNPDYLRGVSRAGDTRSGSQIYLCDVSPGRGSSGRSNDDRSTRSRVPPPDLADDGFRNHAFDGMNSGIVFQRRSENGVGNAKVIDMGFLDAVDVWGNIGSGYEVCFPNFGRIVFLDASTAPRALLYPEYHHEAGLTCAKMTSAGTLVLVASDEERVDASSQPTEEPQPAPTIDPATLDDIADAIELDGCTVTPRVNLNLRQAPWEPILAVIPANTEVPATARTENWFKVTYEETEGWIAAWLVNTYGDCGWRE